MCILSLKACNFVIHLCRYVFVSLIIKLSPLLWKANSSWHYLSHDIIYEDEYVRILPLLVTTKYVLIFAINSSRLAGTPKNSLQPWDFVHNTLWAYSILNLCTFSWSLGLRFPTTSWKVVAHRLLLITVDVCQKYIPPLRK